MASAVTVQHTGARDAITLALGAPNATTATVVTSWLDMQGFERFWVAAANAVLTGNGLTKLEVVAADDASGTNVIQILDSGALSGASVGNGAFLEGMAIQVREVSAAAGTKARYIAARITVANSSDKVSVTLVRAMAKHPQLNLTPATF